MQRLKAEYAAEEKRKQADGAAQPQEQASVPRGVEKVWQEGDARSARAVDTPGLTLAPSRPGSRLLLLSGARHAEAAKQRRAPSRACDAKFRANDGGHNRLQPGPPVGGGPPAVSACSSAPAWLGVSKLLTWCTLCQHCSWANPRLPPPPRPPCRYNGLTLAATSAPKANVGP